VRRTRLRAGDSFNELTLLHATPPPSTVTAATPVRLWAVDGDVFRALINGEGADIDGVE
jgi:CRP-like cAMP-binding protein